MKAKTSSLRIILINIIIIVLLMVVSFVAMEWILRLYIPDMDHKGMNELAPAPLYYRIIPNYQGILEGVKVTINQDGYRDGEFVRNIPENQKLIVVIGDSITFGQGVAQDKTFPAVLQNLLNSGEKTDRFRVWNLGVPGYNTAQEIEVFRSLVLPQKPYWIILAYVVNDVEPVNEGALRIIGGEKPHNEKSWISRQIDDSLLIYIVKSRLGQFIRWFKPDYLVSSYVDDTISLYTMVQSPWSDVSSMIESMKTLSHENDIRFTVAMMPSMIDFERYPFEKISKIVEKFCKDKGIDYLDLLQYFKGMDPSGLHVSMVDSHPNAMAYNIIAKALANHILNSTGDRTQNSGG